MSLIHIDLGRVQGLNTSLNSIAQKSAAASRGVGNIRIDYAITSRRQIGHRMYKTNSRLIELERRIRAIQIFANQSVEKYGNTESEIMKRIPGGAGSIIFGSVTHHIGDPGGMKNQISAFGLLTPRFYDPNSIMDKMRAMQLQDPPKSTYIAAYPNTCGPNYTEKSSQYEEKKKGPGWLAKGFSFALDFVPIVGNVKSAIEAISGKDVITGEKLSTAERWLAAAGTFIPWVRKADTVIDVAKRADDVIDGIGDARKVPVGTGDLAESSLINRYMPDGRVLSDVTELPGAQGIVVPKRLTPEEMEFLTKEHGVEFAQIYRTGSGTSSGRGGQYELYSGVHNRVNVPIGKDVMLISHTHPRGTARPSPDDLILMELLELAGSPQKTSQIVPVGKAPVYFDKNGLKKR
ncbi:pre-toxin TG domain-containing protein [Paenibacillus sp. GCM10027627]|uniref:pre-toxin TG domain-containing protein n=1 Tax=unclassified Paenibacillus TaxID=185978 RepID=UPI00362E1E7B